MFSINEMLFYGGQVLTVVSAVLLLIYVLISRRTRENLKKLLDEEYGEEAGTNLYQK